MSLDELYELTKVSDEWDREINSLMEAKIEQQFGKSFARVVRLEFNNRYDIVQWPAICKVYNNMKQSVSHAKHQS